MYRFLSLVIILVFVAYWSAVLVMALPANKGRIQLANTFPRFSKTFGHTWRLFTPPYTYHHRLYFIIRDKTTGFTDTIEVLEPIARNKQEKAPFNQPELVVDYLVNPNVAAIMQLMWSGKQKPAGMFPAEDSIKIAQSIASVEGNNHYKFALLSLVNYCRYLLKQQTVSTSHKQVKLIITEKPIRPFTFPGSQEFKPIEKPVYESVYQILDQ